MYKLKNKNIAILSGSIRYRPINKTFYLLINSRILAKYVKSSDKKLRGYAFRKKNLFFLRLDNNGNVINTNKKDISVCISGNNLLAEEEILNLKDRNTKLSFPVRVALYPKQFNFDKYYLYADKDAQGCGKISL